MKTLTVTSQRGHKHQLIIGEMSWPVRFIEAMTSLYNPHWGWDYRIWNAILIWCNKWDRELISIPIEHSCTVASKLWPTDDDMCWHHQEAE